MTMVKKKSALFQQEQLHREKLSDTMLTDKMMKELKALKHRKIDLSDEDAPEITDWQKSVVGKFYRPIKKQVTIRIDMDVLEWFRHSSKKYQTLINTACREYMMHHGKRYNKTKQKNL
jgi:uncharacterized protein (DUF4415 family)